MARFYGVFKDDFKAHEIRHTSESLAQAHERDSAVDLPSHDPILGGYPSRPRSFQRFALGALLPGAGEPDQSCGRGRDGGRTQPVMVKKKLLRRRDRSTIA